MNGLSDATRGVWGGGEPATNIIDFVTIASTGNASDFGDLFSGRYGVDSLAGRTRGLFTGGSNNNIMEYITIQSTGNAIDFGDRTIADFYNGAACSPTRAVFSGDYQVVTMDAVEIMSTGNAFDFGDLTQGRLQNVGTSNGHGGL